MGLCRYTPATVWVMRPGKSGRPAKGIIASLAGAKGKVKCNGLNGSILKTAANLAKAEGSDLHIVHAVSLPGRKGSARQRLGRDTEKRLREIRTQIKDVCNIVLGDIGLRLTDDRIHLPIGSAKAALPEFIRQHDLDLIVMGTHGRTGLQRVVMGSVAEQVVRTAPCAVLTVKE